ncbi:hypothetical protein CRE_15844 [Caenorhabditis remanei]|uniref:Tc1-like transposase DDE domain-containing protein n=1 Tax=Caenorhabditis remanei TaxID=31234 RepID=E3NTQ1_CAERE|nr:hypothetical protein CRE_15844 [Caenorhabditis remanei]
MAPPSRHRSSILNLLKEGVLPLGTFLDRRGRGRKATVVTPDRIKAVNQGIGRIAHRSIRKMAKGMKISWRLLGRIVKDKLKLICYRERKAAILSEATTKKRLERSKKLLQRTLNGEHLVTVFFDEKLFTVQAEFNPQNHRVLAETSEEDFANGKAIHQGSHPASVMVFGAVCADGKPQSFGLLHLGVLQNKVNAKPHSSIEALKKTLVKEWDALSPDYLRATIDAYPRRLRAVIEKRGGRMEQD